MIQATATVAAECAAAQDDVGIVLVSEGGPAETRTTVARAARDGFVSPLRFVAAPPASLVGVACIVMGFHGPTLNLTTPARTGVPAGLTIATRWLDRGKVRYAIVASYGRWEGRGLVARCLLLARNGSSPAAGVLPSGLEPSWLIPPG
jgi:3-oxoacyl-(acyl-carrier-protein) synthase